MRGLPGRPAEQDAQAAGLRHDEIRDQERQSLVVRALVQGLLPEPAPRRCSQDSGSFKEDTVSDSVTPESGPRRRAGGELDAAAERGPGTIEEVGAAEHGRALARGGSREGDEEGGGTIIVRAALAVAADGELPVLILGLP